MREFTEVEKSKFRTGILNAFKSSEMTCSVQHKLRKLYDMSN